MTIKRYLPSVPHDNVKIASRALAGERAALLANLEKHPSWTKLPETAKRELLMMSAVIQSVGRASPVTILDRSGHPVEARLIRIPVKMPKLTGQRVPVTAPKIRPPL